MPDNLTIFEVSGGIALLTVHRPDKLNALNRQVMDELDELFAEVEIDPRIRGLIITGAGEKAFVAGADISELARETPVEAHRHSLDGQRVLRRLERMTKPSVAAINGYALGGGLELALCCDIRIASERAKLGLPEVRLAVTPGSGGTQRLPRVVGPARAKELILTGRVLTAGEAERIGLVSEVVPAGEARRRADEIAAEIATRGPLAVREAKRLIDAAWDTGLAAGLAAELDASERIFASDDMLEGAAAFFAKRDPEYHGR